MKNSTASHRPRVGVISIHPAPYRDPTFALVHQRGVVNLQVLTMFEHDAGHPYWNLGEPPYPNIFLGRGYCIRENICWHPRILSLLRKNKFDAIVVPGYNHITSQLAILCCIASRTPLIFNSDGVLFTPNSTVRRPSRDRLVRLVLKYSAAVWVPGKASRDYMRYYDVPSERIFEGSYCLDTERLTVLVVEARKTRLDTRARLGLNANSFLILFAGRMVPERGLRFLAEAFSRVSRSRKSISLLLIGKGTERHWLEEFFGERNLSNVQFRDPIPIEQITQYYTAADAYVLPSVNETYSLALAHAAVSSLPMITTDRVGAAADYVLDGETGYIVPAGDARALANAIAQLSSNVSLARRMGERAYQVSLRRTTQWAAEQLEAAVYTATGRRCSIAQDL